jgi:hypothetical protein
MSDPASTPASVIVAAANEHDANFILPLIFTKLPTEDGANGHPQTQPRSVCVDAGYTPKDVPEKLARTNIREEIPQRGETPAEGLDRRRWPLEKTIA